MAIFAKSAKAALDTQQISTLISEGCSIDGNINAPAFIRIDGQVSGDVKVEGGLILGEKGLISGNVSTSEMIVYGTVKGNLNLTSLEIKSSGRIEGEITTRSLVVEHGAVYNGKLLMTTGGLQEPGSKVKQLA